MLQVTRTRGENIDRLLKRFKVKFTKTKLVKEIRKRMYYKKPSIIAREVSSKGAYKQSLITKAD
jgi:small subunit ribosomal protein S21